MTEIKDEKQNWISGFWKRIGALFIDSLLLGALGFILGLVFENIIMQMGGWSRFIGFFIALLYFGIGNSSITGGQTIGKKLLKLRVVNQFNSPISIGRSTLRYIIFATPFSLNGAHFTNEAMFSPLIYPLCFIIFGGIFSIFYLYVFNRITRQSLHDLIVGSYVVNAASEKQDIKTIWRGHLVVVALLFLSATIAPAFTTQLAENEPFKEMLAIQSALIAQPEVSYAAVSTNTNATISLRKDFQKTNYVSGQIFLKENNVNDVDLARKYASMIIDSSPEVINTDVIQIVLIYGYDIGIWSQWFKHAHNFNPRNLYEE